MSTLFKLFHVAYVSPGRRVREMSKAWSARFVTFLDGRTRERVVETPLRAHAQHARHASCSGMPLWSNPLCLCLRALKRHDLHMPFA